MKLIDGEKLIEDLRRYKHEVISVDGLEGLISLMPSAQPELEKGKWIPCDVDIRGMTDMFVCSKCGSFTSLPILKYANAMEYDFCPNCGAKMRGEKDE